MLKLFCLTLLALVLSACGGGEKSADAEKQTVSNQAQSQGLIEDISQLGLHTSFTAKDQFGNPVNTFQQGQNIILELSITNSSSQDRTLKFFDSQLKNFHVIDGSDNVIWNWDENQQFNAERAALLVPAGETVTQQVDWDQILSNGSLVPQGEYTVYAYFMNYGRTEEFSVFVEGSAEKTP